MFLLQVVKCLRDAKVPYAIVGGYAVALYGIPRGTLDVDFVIEWSLENLKKAEAALKTLGLVSKIPVDAENVYRFRDEYINNRNLIAWNFYDPVHLSHQVDVIITFDLRHSSVTTIKSSGESLRVLSKKDLIAMKKAAGRPQDLEDVSALERL